MQVSSQYPTGTLRALVTGAKGFIGSHLCDELGGRGYCVVKVDKKHGGCDIFDHSRLNCLMHGVDYVFHLAGIPSVPFSIRRPLTMNHTHVTGTLNVLKASACADVKRFVFASSASTKDCASPYAASKLAGEAYCSAFTQSYGLPTVSLRYFNVYGPGQTSGVVAKFIRAALDGKALEITGDGTQTRDFVYVKDVVKATALAAEQGLSGVMEVGTGEAISINSLAETVLRLTNSHSKVVHTEAQAGEAHDSVASDSCLSLHNWFSVYSLEDGLAETIEAMK